LPYGKLSAVRLRTCSIALFAVAVLTGCGSSQPRSDAPAPTAQAAAFKGSPPALISLHAQADKLLPGGLPAFRARLASLHGYPVVVNKWASWCGPCQIEFPAFQQAAVRFGRQVAFIGLDADDGSGSAAAFLHRYPVSYPSYADPHSNIAQAYRASTYFPQTLFFTRDGHGDYVFDHAGPYESAAALEKDIRHYVLR
jgi:cytochrome c biogenesis protein CcmG, thiol:disulfide interchange protein DsbE